MISIPVSFNTHLKLSRLSKWLCIAAFVVFGGMLGLSGISGYLQASTILKDHSVVSAPVQLKEIEEQRGRKGRVSYTYHFTYTFNAAGKPRTGAFSTSESNATPYMEEEATVRVAYSNRDPSNFERLSTLESHKGLGAVLKRLLIALVFAAVLALVAHLLITRRLFVIHLPAAPPAV